MEARLGDIDLLSGTDDDPEIPPVVIPVEDAIRHPDYLQERGPETQLLHDIGLVKLAREAPNNGERRGRGDEGWGVWGEMDMEGGRGGMVSDQMPRK